MVLHNPNNWHWVNKDASAWAKNYFEETLIGTAAENPDGTSVEVVKVLSVEGDVDVSQRKGKNTMTPSGTSVSGTITIPEVAHDTEESEYVFETSNYSDSNEKQAVRELVRTDLTVKLRKKLVLFAGALMDQHGKDIQHTKENDPRHVLSPSTSDSSPASQPIESGRSAEATPNTINHPKSRGVVINTTDISENFEFQTSAEELYLTFVDAGRVAAFTRSVPQIFEPRVGGSFKLFSGNVEGSFVSLNQPTEIVQKWRLSGWPEGHYSILSLTFDQGYDTTTLRLSWKGVPIGQEEVTRRNFAEYYTKSIKLTFGFGAIL